MKKFFILAISLMCMQLAMAQTWNSRRVSSTFGYNKNSFVGTVNITDGTITPLMVLAIADPMTIELGESVTLTANASGGTGNYTYSWQPSATVANPSAQSTTATPTEAGIIEYEVTVNDGASTASSTVMVEVTVPQPVVCPAPNHFRGVSYYDNGDFGAHLSWDKADYAYTLDRFEIYRSDDNITFKMVQRIVNTPSIEHYECDDQVSHGGLFFYKIIAFYQNNCQSDPVVIDVEISDNNGVGENVAGNFALYPNPTSGMVNIKADAMQQITVVNMPGQVVLVQNIDNDEVTIDMSAFENGMYLVNIMTENGKVVKILNVLR